MRKLAQILALVAGLTPGWVYALGLGNITLNSYLNQPFDADIRLISATPADLESLQVSLASPAEFLRAGLDFSNSLRQLHFAVKSNANGQSVINVTTADDFREPFISFLVEVKWAQGRIVREYTVLVDPPVTAAAKAPAIAPARSTSAGRSKASATPPRARAGSQTPTVASSRGAGGKYGPTQRSDTLWTISERLRPKDTSMDQVMLALVRSNPQAFTKGNINGLKAGYVLKVPSREAMQSVAAADARAEVLNQNKLWRSGATKSATAPASTSTASQAGEKSGRLTLLAPEAASKQANTSANGGGSATQAGGSGGTPESALAAKETTEAMRQENKDLHSRIGQLEQQVQDMKRLSQLKNDQLAQLQQQLAKLKGQGAPASVASPQSVNTPASVASPATTSAPAVAATTAAVEKKPPVEARPAPSGSPVNPYQVEGFHAVNPASLPKTPAAQPFKNFAQPTAAGKAAAPLSFSDKVRAYAMQGWSLARENPMIAGGILLAIIILLLLLAIIRQRRRAADGFQESILREPPTPAADMAVAAASGAAAVAAATAVAREPQADDETSSYLSDFGISGMDSIQSDIAEADPLTEADVFLAYGRFQAAESMIQEAIDHEPDRLDLKVKLIEIHHAARNRDAFEREAQALHGLIEDHNGPVWAKVVEMGEDLCPDSPLFRDDAELWPEDLDSDQGNAAEEAPGHGLELADDAESDRRAEPRSDGDMIDFDLGEFEGDSDKPRRATPGESAAEDRYDLDFDLGEHDAEVSSADETVKPVDTDVFAAELADELSGIAQSIESEDDQSAVSDTESSRSNDDDVDDREEPEPTAVVDGALSDVDEVGTKLDLARAYIDMGDPEGARSILDEVLEEGNEQQRGEAHELLQQIS